MSRLALLWIPAVLMAGEARYARLGEVEGRPEIQMHAAEPWRPGVRNLVVPEGAWIRTSPGSRAEVELDDGGAWRMDAAGLCEFSDYRRLSTGQRITLISLDTGVAYFTGEARGADSLVLAVPGAQITVREGARVRLEAREGWSRIGVIEGAVTFSSPGAELRIEEGSMVRVEPANAQRFFLYREFTALESDAWSEARDKALVSASAGHVAAPPFGLADLDRAGTWIDTASGIVWKPEAAAAGWAPFRNGRWIWYESLGYTWVSSEPWGWLPYHYGRWNLDQASGWVWAPGTDAVFSPGDVYWLRGAKMAGWGPLAPGEPWDGRTRPRLFLNAHTTFAPFAAEAREIDPSGFGAPREPLAAAAFTAALPSPALAAGRLEAARPVLRAGSTRVVPRLEGVTYGHGAPAVAAEAPAPLQAPEPVVAMEPPAPPAPPLVVEQPVEVYYPVPVPAGIVVLNPPERGHGRGIRRPPRRRDEDEKPVQPAPIRRTEEAQERRPERTPDPPPAPPAPAPIKRTEEAREQRRERAPDPAHDAGKARSEPARDTEKSAAPAGESVKRTGDAAGRSGGGSPR